MDVVLERTKNQAATTLARRVIFALSLATVAEGVFIGGILPIIPAIVRRYEITSGEAFWLNAVYLLAVGVTCPALSRLGDIYGHKKMTILTLIVSMVGIALDVVAPNYGVFLVGRFLLGFCPAITPLAIGIFRNSLSEQAALYGIGSLAAAMTAGHAIGPVFAAYVFSATSGIGWVFASWIALLGPSVIAIMLLVPASPAPATRRAMDWPGAVMLGGGVAAILLAFAYGPKAGWGNTIVLGAIVLGVALLVAWYKFEQRTAFPLVDLRMLNNPRARPYYISSFLWGFAYYGSQTTVVLFLGASHEKLGFGFSVSVLTLGWLLLPQYLVTVVGALIVAKIVRSFGGYRTCGIIGGVALGVGFAGMMVATHILWQFMLFSMMTGFGSGLLQTTLSGRVSQVCLPDERGISAGMYQTFKNIGGAMASAFGSATFAALVINGTKIASERAYMIVFVSCLLVSMLIVAALQFGQRDKADQATGT
ncbi:MFS transporter [Paraburkholderia sp. Ac-20342]|uniref:MFS transporter n=1 Tax=Paraburkholderia sp. Ac-20342 TaxID=2703889 RepID=UPI001980035B|nr:MFS transporter [Paraburkholderia sp. Ac-20342]MBN3851409.1 MFS transporter [Paraburkholderia sp. Ac-20342]